MPVLSNLGEMNSFYSKISLEETIYILRLEATVVLDLRWKSAVGTLLTFSAGVTQFGWFYAGDLSSCSTHTAWLSFIRLVN